MSESSKHVEIGDQDIIRVPHYDYGSLAFELFHKFHERIVRLFEEGFITTGIFTLETLFIGEAEQA